MKIQMGQILPCLIICTLFSIVAVSQNKGVLISTRISLQSDLQKAQFSPDSPTTIHSTITANWGIDLLIEKYITNKFSAYLGAGYFRNKFNFKRGYDHRLLNIGKDSVLIFTSTYNYTYHLFRLPMGITYKVNYACSIGLENIFNFSFKQVYNGGKPFPGANTENSNFQYYGNSIIIFARASKPISQTSFLQIEPYIRILNIYRRQDKFLYENLTRPYTRIFDAVGLSVKYSFNLQQKKYRRKLMAYDPKYTAQNVVRQRCTF